MHIHDVLVYVYTYMNLNIKIYEFKKQTIYEFKNSDIE